MTVFMALVDFIPVLFFLVSAISLQRDLYSKMSKGAFALFSAGTIMVIFAGVYKAAWSGCRRLEIRQTKNYGNDPEYQKYVKTTPIMLPFVPIYSVARFNWLRG